MTDEIKEQIPPKRIKELLTIRGGARGIHFKIDKEYVLKKKGKQGLQQLEKYLAEHSCPIDYASISGLNFYPAGLRAISLLAIKGAFGWGDEEIKNLCSYAVGASLIVKIYMKFFYSIPKMLEKAPDIWHDYFNYGKLSVGEYDLDQKYINLKLEDFALDSVYCVCLTSFLETVAKLTIGSDYQVECLETKCLSRNDNYHNFLLSWKKKK